MSSTKLRKELLDDPLGRDYAAMDDAAVLVNLTDAALRPVADRTSITSSELYEALVRADYIALQPAEQDEVKILLGLGETIIISAGSKARATLVAIFGSGSQTRTNLLGLIRDLTQSRAQELGLRADLAANHIAASRIPAQPSGPDIP